MNRVKRRARVSKCASVTRLVALLALTGSFQFAWSQAGEVQPGFENAGRPRAEFLIGDLKAQVGKKYWVRRPMQGQLPIALFCDTPVPPSGKDCPREKLSIARDESFTIEDVAIAKPDPGLSWLKIRFDANKTPAYLSLQDFTEQRYNEARFSAALMGIDYTLANSGWLFDDYPDKILNNRRAQLERERDAPKLEQERIANERVMRVKLLYVGMSSQQVLNSVWGPPNSVSVTYSGWRRLEQWDYGGGTVLFFEGERLVRYQISGR